MGNISCLVLKTNALIRHQNSLTVWFRPKKDVKSQIYKVIFVVCLTLLTIVNLEVGFNSLILRFLVWVMCRFFRFNSIWDMHLWVGDLHGVKAMLRILTVWVRLVLLGSLFIERLRVLSSKLFRFIIVLVLILLVFFIAVNFFILYVTFELSLVPIFLIIIGWGYQVERFKARLIILFYTLFARLPLLLGFLYIELCGQTRLIPLIILSYRDLKLFRVITLALILAFLVKTPIFLVHSWLPKAHVEAPVFGSIRLAALLLKLGTYGIYHFSIIGSLNFGLLIVRISVMRLFTVRLNCLRVIDIKIIIALSSVSHIGLVLISLYFQRGIIKLGRIFIILAHGARSRLLFFGAGWVYEQCHSRMLLLSKGLRSWVPIFRLFWFLRIILNMAAPPRINLLREILIIMFGSRHIIVLRVWFIFGILIRTGYSLIIYRVVVQGWELMLFEKLVIKSREILVFLGYLVPGYLGVLGFYVFI